jgi:hypothetical protein
LTALSDTCSLPNTGRVSLPMMNTSAGLAVQEVLTLVKVNFPIASKRRTARERRVSELLARLFAEVKEHGIVTIDPSRYESLVKAAGER